MKGRRILLTFYHAYGSSSLASHIALEETGAPHQARLVDLPNGEQRTADYLAINPRGRVPALRIETGAVLTENVAILLYLARRFPQVKLLPSDPFAEARVVSLAAFFASSVHVAHRHIRQPHQYTPDETAYAAIQDVGRKTFYAYLQEIDGLLAGREWLFDQYTIADPYALIFYWSGVRQKMPMRELAAYTAHLERMVRRPAVRRVLEKDPQAGVLLYRQTA
jgi:glutathione S-transferase